MKIITDKVRYMRALSHMSTVRSSATGHPLSADEIADLIGIDVKRAMVWLHRWTKEGLWNYGVSVAQGWLTPQGRLKAEGN